MNLGINKIRQSKSSLAVLVALLTFLIIILAPAMVTAATNFLPNTPSSEFLNSDNGGQVDDVYLFAAKRDAGYGYELDAKKSVVKVYFRASSGTLRIRDGNWCKHSNGGKDSNSNPKTRFLVYRTNANESAPGPPAYTANSTHNCNNRDIVLNITGLTRSTVPGHENYYVALFMANYNNTRGGINAFRLSATSSAKISYFAGSTHKFALGQAWLTSGTPPRPRYADYKLQFAPDCRVNSNTVVSLNWFDADAGEANQARTLRTELWETRPNGTRHRIAQFVLSGGDDEPGSRDFTAKPDHKYEWYLFDVSSRNGVQFQLPYDSINFDITCDNDGQNFTITPAAEAPALNPDTETVTTANFTSDIAVSPSTGVTPVTVTRQYYLRRLTANVLLELEPTPIASTGRVDNNSGPYNETRSIPIPPGVVAGDRVCQRITVEPHRGTVDSSGQVINITDTDEADEACTTVINRPYLKVYGGGVGTGGAFDLAHTQCRNADFGDGEISTYARFNSGNAVGSSAQYAAMARGVINFTDQGFYSASLRPSSPGYLTFANNNFNGSSDWGGRLGAGRCLVDFYDANAQYTRFLPEADTPRIESASVPLNSLADGQQYQRNGNLTITSSGITGRRVTIYVNGNVHIAGEIVYSGTYPSADPNAIPYVTIIASGNIFIDKSIHTLSGLFIAQPDSDGNDGEIFTCTSGFIPVSDADKFTQCDGGRPLTINGAFVAKKVHFGRAHGSLRQATVGEGLASINMAEKFNLLPELYIGQPVFRRLGGDPTSGYGEAQSYTGLPPIL